MKRSVRNRLADLLLEGFEDPEKRSAVVWLALFCELAARRDRPEIPLAELLTDGRAAFHGIDSRSEAGLAHLIGPEKLLRLRRADTGEVADGGAPRGVEGVPWLLEPEPEVRASFPAVCERARVYAGLLAGIAGGEVYPRPEEPLRRAMAEAALCFNAGLFFEAHEHLEHRWVTQPKGPTKRFLQGIIQISVGFHHAREGNYDGAVNQLAKGLEKTSGITGRMLGLDCEDFLPKVTAAREAIVNCGRSGMRPMPLSEIPRMRLRQ